MFGLVKKLFGKKPEPTPAPVKPGGAASATPVRTPPKPVVTPAAAAAVAAAKAAANPNGVVEQIQVSLLGIVSLLPQELRPVRALGDVASVVLTFAPRPLLEQLSHGCVRVPFSEVRKRAPEGFFTAGNENDTKLVELPLQEVLAQLGSRGFVRRKEQKVVTVPDEVVGLFSNRGDIVSTGLKASNPTTMAAQAQAQAAAQAAAASASSSTVSVPPTLPTMAPTAAAPAPAPVQANPQPAANPFASAPAKPAIPGPAAPIQAKAAVPAPAIPAAPAVPPAPVEAAPPKSSPISGAGLLQALQSHGSAPAKPAAAAPAAVPAPAEPVPVIPPSTGDTQFTSKDTLSLPLDQLMGTWPDAVKAEIKKHHWSTHKVALPLDEIGLALSAGRIQYTWGRLVQLLEGEVGAQVTSAHSGTTLDIPLALVAPLYMTRRKARKASRNQASSSPGMNEITDLFYKDKASAEAAAAAVSASAVVPAPAPAAAPAPSVSAPRATVSAPAAAPVPAAASAAPAPSGQVFSVPVAMVNESWFDSLKSELAKLNRPDLKLEMPFEEMNRALRAGKVEYTWRQLREWMRPAISGDVGADVADKPLTLPLKVVAPLFLGQFNKGRTAKKVELETDIPDPFMGNVPGKQSQIEAGVGAGAEKVDGGGAAGANGANSFSTTQFMRKPPADLGELFGQPGKRNWTPQEIVQNTTRIRGVGGALITMEDGLLVAGQMSGALKAEATAAFVPQIYQRLSKYMTELGAGETQSVQINTAQGALVVFKAGIIFFAVVGKPDEAFPMAPIRLIAAELSRHAK